MKNLYTPMVRPKGGGLEKEVVKESDLKSEIENPKEEITGLVIGDRKILRLYNFETKGLETIIKLPRRITALGFHDDELWMGHGLLKNRIDPLGQVYDLKRNRVVNFFFSHEGVVFDGGRYGIKETISGREHITKKDLKNKHIISLKGSFYHNGNIFLLTLTKDGLNGFCQINTDQEKISLGDLCLKIDNTGAEVSSGAISFEGKIITTNSGRYIDIDGYIEDCTKLPGHRYRCIALDAPRKRIYVCGIDLKTVMSFNIENKAERLILTDSQKLVNGLSSFVYAILPVTKEQMEVIREQAK